MNSQQVSEKSFIGQDAHILVMSIGEPCAEMQNSGKLPNCSGALQQADRMKLANVCCVQFSNLGQVSVCRGRGKSFRAI